MSQNKQEYGGVPELKMVHSSPAPMETYVRLLLVLGTAVLASSSVGKLPRQKRFMPYIYPGGSVIQFAMGLALPADVKGRNVATNSGILINIDLPTNLSQLRPPGRSVRSAEGHRVINSQVAALLGLSESSPSSNRCFEELDCYRRKFESSNGLLSEIIGAIIGSVLNKDNSLSGNVSTPTEYCDILNGCDSPYTNIVKTIYSLYNIPVTL